MAAIRFPESVGIGNRGIRTGSGPLENKRPSYVKRAGAADMLEISSEAQERFRSENLVLLDRIRLMKEAGKFRAMLADDIDWRGADLRNVYRLRNIVEARRKLADGVYDDPSEEMLRSMLEGPEL